MSEDERVAVKTYVPRYQKERWQSHADELDMSQSEFVRTMVQAGRSDIGVPGAAESDDERAGRDSSSKEANAAGAASAATEDFESRIRDALARDGALDWDELVEALVDDVEAELDGALERLQAADEVRHRGRDGGYVLIDDE